MTDTQPDPQTGRRLAVFLDGTWDQATGNTNVWRLKSLCRSDPESNQKIFYSAGVGTTFGESFRGGVFGYGIDDVLTQAYQWLIETWQEGDELFKQREHMSVRHRGEKHVPGATWDDVDFGLTRSMSRYSSSLRGGSIGGTSEDRFELVPELGAESPKLAPAGSGTSWPGMPNSCRSARTASGSESRRWSNHQKPNHEY